MAYRLRLKEILREKGISQGKLSRGADVALNTIRKMVSDPNHTPNVYTLRKIADYLGVTLDDLFVNDETPGS
ncbi:MAG TPA: helix-turn-helix transcriptional regulator [Ktedonobacteraceae bacterium]|nr:helix-turn-helix transcriptional regulator [Ktedonobacteraceae bacterium]